MSSVSVFQSGGGPQLVPRARSAASEAVRDREMLLWIARFRFVDAAVLAERFDVSKQQISARMRRLEAAGLIERKRENVVAGSTIATTPKGARAIGEPPRRAPRTTVQREHELEIARLVTRLERSATPPHVLTERQCRQREATSNDRYSADTIEPGRGPARRWPDLVIETNNTREAVELELTPKGTARLRAIIAGYTDADWFDTVTFLTPDAPTARRLRGLIAEAAPNASDLFPSVAGPRLRVIDQACEWLTARARSRTA